MQGLFRNFDDAFLPLFRPHLERLVADTKHDTHECSHRCAAEIISGVIRGSKHWTYEKVTLGSAPFDGNLLRIIVIGFLEKMVISVTVN